MNEEMNFSCSKRDEGATLALEAEARKFELAWAVTKAARALPEFTSDDVWHLLREIQVTSSEHPNALGAMFLVASRQGIIRNSGMVQKTIRLSSHRRAVTIWRSLIFNGGNHGLQND